MTSWFAEHAWICDKAAPGQDPGIPRCVRNLRLVEASGRWESVTVGATPAPGDVRLPGVVFPGFANSHSHAFHRALRGRTHGDGGTFWTWREQMYAVARSLTPQRYFELARAVYAEMALAGVTAVGEFHYVHHDVGGTPYAPATAMDEALSAAAAEAGIRLTLLDTLYLAGGLDGAGHRPLDEGQLRFGDADIDDWWRRVSARRSAVSAPHVRLGVAMHSVRAVPRDALVRAGQLLAGEPDLPVHAHVSEQPAENAAALAAYGLTPVGLLEDAGLVDDRFTAVHATHLTDQDIATLGERRGQVSFCPTTERDLADGIGPAKALAAAGVSLSLGSDQHAVIDPFEELRALELHERLTTQERGRFSPGELVEIATRRGFDSIGWPGGGQLRVGAPADLVAVRTDSVRTAGCALDQVHYAATAADVATVVRDGEAIVDGGRHDRLGDVGALLSQSISQLRGEA